MPKFSIVIPAHNEEKGVRCVLEDLLQSKYPEGFPYRISDFEIIVVNDGSTDRTENVVREYIREDVPIRIVNHQSNEGYGTALKTGFKEAKGEYIGFLDADGSYVPEFIYMLFARLIETGADIVWGTRMMNGRQEMPPVRWVGNAFFRWFTNLIFRSTLTDVTSGMRVFRRELAHHFLPLPYGLEFSPAMSAIALQRGLTIKEVPIPYRERIGKSKLQVVKDGLKFFAAIILSKAASPRSAVSRHGEDPRL